VRGKGGCWLLRKKEAWAEEGGVCDLTLFEGGRLIGKKEGGKKGRRIFSFRWWW